MLESEPPSKLQARRLAESLSEALCRQGLVVAVILVGSYARGDFVSSSDIDIVAITKRSTTSRQIRNMVPILAANPRLSVYPYSRDIFRMRYRLGDLFIRHVIEEGEVIYDDGSYRRLLEEPFPKNSEQALRELELVKKKLGTFELKAFNRLYLDYLAQLYALSVQTAIAALILAGHPEYNKRRMFKQMARLYPKVKTESANLERLAPFALAATKGLHQKMPFPPVGSEKEVKASVSSLKKVIDEVESTNR